MENKIYKEMTCRECNFMTGDVVCVLDGEEKDLDEPRGVECELSKEYIRDCELVGEEVDIE